ncbi:MAG: hypothetical protein MZV65_39775 [Chromatiales bacterium]|nr:hypothetical protein [Chromatiales bacterium]
MATSARPGHQRFSAGRSGRCGQPLLVAPRCTPPTPSACGARACTSRHMLQRAGVVGVVILAHVGEVLAGDHGVRMRARRRPGSGRAPRRGGPVIRAIIPRAVSACCHARREPCGLGERDVGRLAAGRPSTT